MSRTSVILTPELIITIDGPAGSGKSTTARLLAQKLDYLYLDTGAMYRAITLKVLRNKVDEQQHEAVIKLVAATDIELQQRKNAIAVFLDGEEISALIRSPEIDHEISWVCQIPEVRERMIALQRELGRNGGIVAEGRDMGTVVFPEADLKFFLTADLEIRGQRRWQEMQAKNIEISLMEVIAELQRRDQIDMERPLSPLQKAEDAIEINTTNMTIVQQTNFMLQKAQQYMRWLALNDSD